MKISTKGHYALDIYKAVLADGGTSVQATSELNRMMFPDEWAAALARGEVERWVPSC